MNMQAREEPTHYYFFTPPPFFWLLLLCVQASPLCPGLCCKRWSMVICYLSIFQKFIECSMPGVFRRPSCFGFQLLSKELPLVRFMPVLLILTAWRSCFHLFLDVSLSSWQPPAPHTAASREKSPWNESTESERNPKREPNHSSLQGSPPLSSTFPFCKLLRNLQ